MMFPRLACTGLILALGACATSAPAPEGSTVPGAAMAASDSTGPAMAMHGEGMGAMHGDGMGAMHRHRMGPPGDAAPREVPPDLQEGERIYREICTVCHTMDPPPNLAPPMSHVARHLRQAFPEEDAAVGHIVSFVPEPDPERSVMPAMARDRFGLMPALPMPESSLEAVARYIWFLGSPQ